MTAPSLNEVLAAVNVIRAERDLPALTGLPKGKPTKARECPLAKALECETVGRRRFFISRLSEDDDGVELPQVLQQFVRAFDKGVWGRDEAGAYQELVSS